LAKPTFTQVIFTRDAAPCTARIAVCGWELTLPTSQPMPFVGLPRTKIWYRRRWMDDWVPRFLDPRSDGLYFLDREKPHTPTLFVAYRDIVHLSIGDDRTCKFQVAGCCCAGWKSTFCFRFAVKETASLYVNALHARRPRSNASLAMVEPPDWVLLRVSAFLALPDVHQLGDLSRYMRDCLDDEPWWKRYVEEVWNSMAAPAVHEVLSGAQDGLSWLQLAALLELRLCRSCGRFSPVPKCRGCGFGRVYNRVVFRDLAIDAIRHLKLQIWASGLLQVLGEVSWTACRLRFCTQWHGNSLKHMISLSDLRGRNKQVFAAATIVVVETVDGLVIAAGLQGPLRQASNKSYGGHCAVCCNEQDALLVGVDAVKSSQGELRFDELLLLDSDLRQAKSLRYSHAFAGSLPFVQSDVAAVWSFVFLTQDGHGHHPLPYMTNETCAIVEPLAGVAHRNEDIILASMENAKSPFAKRDQFA